MMLITGAEQGLGAEIARQWDKSIHLNIPGSVIRKGHSHINAAIDAKWDQIIAHFNRGEQLCIVNNFGTNHLSWIGQTDEEDESILQTNLMAPYWVVDKIVRNFDDMGCPDTFEGRIRVLNIASATHRVAQRTTSIYCASKAGLVHMTRVMARELAPRGWVINSLSPGMIEDTVMAAKTNHQVEQLRGWNAAYRDKYAKDSIPMGRYTTTIEVARAAIAILELPNYINGANIDMMGGV